jgi:hypothetical protein
MNRLTGKREGKDWQDKKGAVSLSTGVKRPGSEADHSPPTSAMVKKTRIYTSTPLRLYGIVKHRDNFTFFIPSSCSYNFS